MNYKDNNVVIPGLKSLPRTSSGGNLLSFWKILSLAAVMLFLAACSDDDKTAGGTEEDAGIVAIEDKTVSGVSQKGPFVNGSSVTVYGLDGETLAQTGNIYEGKIKSDMGDFSVKVVKLASQYALLKANGFYRNEVTGEKSNSQMTLYALTDLSDRDEVNVNLLTHLAYERSLYLATDSLSVSKAKKQAEGEVFKSFEIEGDFDVAEDLNIFGENDQSAALLAISVLMQGDLKEADFSERLDNYARDIEADGVWDDKKTATAIADWASTKSLEGGLAAIRNNIASWGLSDEVPDFEKYVNNFWWQNYGLKTCDAKREGEILQASNPLSANNGVHFICNNGGWRVATDLEKDTYKWKAGKDADVKNGDVVATNCYVFEDKTWRSGNENDCSLNLRGCTKLRQDTVGLGSDDVWYICDAKSWREATDYEKDTFGWKASTDGAIKKGNVTDIIYVFDKTAWRATNNVEAVLGGCVSAIADSVGKVESVYYICKSNMWIEANELEYDTYKWKSGKDGDIRTGSVNADNYYVFENGAWRVADYVEAVLGGCVAAIVDSVGKVESTYFICKSNKWVEATTVEYDTYHWANSTDGSMKKGDVTDAIYVFEGTAWRRANDAEMNLGYCSAAIADSVGKAGSTYYICKTEGWIQASIIEYDTYHWGDCEDGEMQKGLVTDRKYVCESGKWRSASAIEEKIGSCTMLQQGKEYDTGYGGFTYVDEEHPWGTYVSGFFRCFDGEWTTSTACSSDRDGATAGKYLCKNNQWTKCEQNNLGEKYASYECFNGEWVLQCTAENDKSFLEGSICINGERKDYVTELLESDDQCIGVIPTQFQITPGSFTDSRDNQVYSTISFDGRVWMSQNLNYNASGSMCPSGSEESDESCEKYGRLYRDNPCPEGWRLPNMDDLYSLVNHSCYYGSSVGKNLKASEGWYEEGYVVDDEYSGERVAVASGSDPLGFSALPAGSCWDVNRCYTDDDLRLLYENGSIDLGAIYLKFDSDRIFVVGYQGWSGVSVRCIKDEE